jgi:hypothetical protein
MAQFAIGVVVTSAMNNLILTVPGQEPQSGIALDVVLDRRCPTCAVHCYGICGKQGSGEGMITT